MGNFDIKNQIKSIGERRLDTHRVLIHEDGVEFKFDDGSIGRIALNVEDIRVEYVRGSVAIVYSNVDPVKPSYMISILKNMVNISNITEV